MATVSPTTIRTELIALRDGAGSVPVETVLQRAIDTLDAAAVGGGIASGRGTFGNDPAALTIGTAASKLVGTGVWTTNIESRGVTSDFATGRLTIQAGGEGHFDVDWNVAFKGTVGRGYIAGVRVSRSGVQSFELDTLDEEAIIAAGQIGQLDGCGRIINLLAGDWVELWCLASAASSTFIMRQAQMRICRVDSP
jgi:hypothetical protein